LLIKYGKSFLDKTLALGFNPLNHVVRTYGGAGSHISGIRDAGVLSCLDGWARSEKFRLFGEPGNRFASGQLLNYFSASAAKVGWRGLVFSALNFNQLAADTR
jgi:hypothetical protein